MKSIPYIQSTVVVLLGVVVSCSPVSDVSVSRLPVSSSMSIPTAKSSGLTGELFKVVNTYRSENGKNVLERHSGLDQLAQEHCDYLVKNCNGKGTNINHSGFRLRAFNAGRYFNIPSVGENVVSSPNKSAPHLLKLWISSPSHEKNMRGAWKYTGIGSAKAPDGTVISTQIFGSDEINPNLSSRDFARP